MGPSGSRPPTGHRDFEAAPASPLTAPSTSYGRTALRPLPPLPAHQRALRPLHLGRGEWRCAVHVQAVLSFSFLQGRAWGRTPGWWMTGSRGPPEPAFLRNGPAGFSLPGALLRRAVLRGAEAPSRPESRESSQFPHRPSFSASRALSSGAGAALSPPPGGLCPLCASVALCSARPAPEHPPPPVPSPHGHTRAPPLCSGDLGPPGAPSALCVQGSHVNCFLYFSRGRK